MQLDLLALSTLFVKQWSTQETSTIGLQRNFSVLIHHITFDNRRQNNIPTFINNSNYLLVFLL